MPFRKDSKQLAELLDPNTFPPRPLLDPFRNWILHPTEHDPLSFGASDAFLGLADRNRSNLVALPDEGAIHLSSHFAKNGLRFDDLKISLDRDYDVRTDPAGQARWLIINPKVPTPTVDRKVLGQAVRYAASHPAWTIQDRATLAALLPKELDYVYWAYLRTVVDDGVYREKPLESKMLRLYALLSPSQRQAAMAKSGLTARSLPSSLRAEIWDCLTDQDGLSLQSVYAANQPLEPTEIFPRGLPDSAFLTIRETLHDVVQVPGLGWQMRTSKREPAVDAADLGECMIKYGRKQPSGYQLDFSKVNLKNERRITIRIQGTPRVYRTEIFRELLPSPDHWLPYQQLPAEFRAQVEKSKSAYRQPED